MLPARVTLSLYFFQETRDKKKLVASLLKLHCYHDPAARGRTTKDGKTLIEPKDLSRRRAASSSATRRNAAEIYIDDNGKEKTMQIPSGPRRPTSVPSLLTTRVHRTMPGSFLFRFRGRSDASSDRPLSRDGRTGSNLDQRPPIAFSDGDESRRRRGGAATKTPRSHAYHAQALRERLELCRRSSRRSTGVISSRSSTRRSIGGNCSTISDSNFFRSPLYILNFYEDVDVA